MSRIAVVTGASRGIGAKACERLAASGWRLVLVAKNPERLEQQARRLQAMDSGCVLSTHSLDLGDLAQVSALASTLLERLERLDALVNNAGVIQSTWELTPQATERTLATNVLAPFILTRRLKPLLCATSGARVVFVSSLVRRWGAIHLDDLSLTNSFTPDAAYNQSKLALVLLARAFSRRATGWVSLSMEPGMTATDFGSDYRGLRAVMRRLYRPFMATATTSGDAVAWLAEQDVLSLVNGGHYVRTKLVSCDGESANDALGERLFEALERMTATWTTSGG